jgi:hypothetical protein
MIVSASMTLPADLKATFAHLLVDAGPLFFRGSLLTLRFQPLKFLVAIERIRRRLASTDDGNRQMVDILNAVLTDGLPAVEAACAEALGHGVHSADVVLNILARQREPAPPANIMTPAALTLRHAPIADCARYDNLRRTI